MPDQCPQWTPLMKDTDIMLSSRARWYPLISTVFVKVLDKAYKEWMLLQNPPHPDTFPPHQACTLITMAEHFCFSFLHFTFLDTYPLYFRNFSLSIIRF